MKRIFIIGAGRSTVSLIKYLLKHSETEQWKIVVGEMDTELALSKTRGHQNSEVIAFDVRDTDSLREQISKSDIVISMLPAHMHVEVAETCIEFGVHMVTASYISPEMKALHDRAVENGVILINEIGVDPGIDHLSAMQLIDEKRRAGAEIVLFESFTGGLLAPESEADNPWKYKFTWNPRNVVVAGQGGAVKFIQEGRYKFIPYHQLFRRTEKMEIEGFGKFEGYANRDSLKYRSVYGLENIQTIYRGTLRRPGYCRAWDVFVKLGMTDDSYVLPHSETMTHRQFLNTYLAYNPHDSVELKLRHYMKIDQDDDIMEKFSYLNLFSDEIIGLPDATPAQCLQHILAKKWTLTPEDRDMVIMYHKVGYRLNGAFHQTDATMVVLGEDSEVTAMAKTVGLPVAIAARLILQGAIQTPGVQIPISAEIYNPMLEELEQNGIGFKVFDVPYRGY
jgi:saccharopine dehydrogenase-like NADP-dependent oxidoreductase